MTVNPLVHKDTLARSGGENVLSKENVTLTLYLPLFSDRLLISFFFVICTFMVITAVPTFGLIFIGPNLQLLIDGVFQLAIFHAFRNRSACFRDEEAGDTRSDGSQVPPKNPGRNPGGRSWYEL